MIDIKNLKDDFSIQQINQLLKIYDRGFDITYIDPELLTVEKLRLFIKDINNYNSEQKGLIKWNISCVPNEIWASNIGKSLIELWKHIIDISIFFEEK